MRKSMLVSALVATSVAAIAVPAAHGDNVTVAVDNPGGSRTLYVEDLLGAPLTTLDFGSTRAQPFRVRVVDSTMDRAGFTVSAAMTNLYLDTPGGLDFTDAIASSNIAISHPANPLNLLDPEVLLAPVFDAVSTVTDPLLCATLSLPVVDGACSISMADIQGVLQSVALPVNLSDLTALPLIPQGSEVGAFDEPAYEGLAANAPQPPGAPPATSRQMLKGNVSATTDTMATVDAALAGALAAQDLTDMIDTGTMTAALRDALGVAYDTLTATQIQGILDATVATVQALVPADLLAQSGTYLSLPLLSVTVPADATAGVFRGTLVVTGLQP